MKLKTKRKISLGALAAVAVVSVPIATVASCGTNASNQDLLSNKPTSVFSSAKASVMAVLSDIKNAAVEYFASKKTDADKKKLSDEVEAARIKTKKTMNKLLSGPDSIIDSLLLNIHDARITKYSKMLTPFLPLVTSMINTLIDDLFINIKNSVFYNPSWIAKETTDKAVKSQTLKDFDHSFESVHKDIEKDWNANEMTVKVLKYVQEIKETKTINHEQATYFKTLSDAWKLHLKTKSFKNNELASHIAWFQSLIVEDEKKKSTLTNSKVTDRDQFVKLFESLSKEIKPTEFDKKTLLTNQKNNDNAKTLDIAIGLLSTVKPDVKTNINKMIYEIVSKTPNSKKHVYVDSKDVTRITIDYSVRSLINQFNKMITYDAWKGGPLIDNASVSALVLKVFGRNNASVQSIASGGGVSSIFALIPKILDDLRNGASTFENNLQPLFSILFGDEGKLVFELQPGNNGQKFGNYKWYSPQLQVFNSEYIMKSKKHYITEADRLEFFGALGKLVQKMLAKH